MVVNVNYISKKASSEDNLMPVLYEAWYMPVHDNGLKTATSIYISAYPSVKQSLSPTGIAMSIQEI